MVFPVLALVISASTLASVANARVKSLDLMANQGLCAKALSSLKRLWSGPTNAEYAAQAELYREKRLELEATAPAYDRKAAAIVFEVDRPGLRIFFEQGPYSGSHTSGYKATNFRLDYDPVFFARHSIERRTLGKFPISYNFKDVRSFSQASILGNDGDHVEIHLKRNLNSDSPENFGAFFFISRDTGKIMFFPPHTHVDGVVERIRGGSALAIFDFALGVADESQLFSSHVQGHWFAIPQIFDGQYVDLSSPRLQAPE